jgi:NTP pyrophosphatase (non-canonical NTP hydrolase)
MEEIVRALRKFRDERNWSRFHTPKDLAISVSIEAGELLEVFQWQCDGHDVNGLDKSRVASEMGEIFSKYISYLSSRTRTESAVARDRRCTLTRLLRERWR